MNILGSIRASLLAGTSRLASRKRRVAIEQRRAGPAAPHYVPDPYNDKTLLVHGWSESEVNRILDDFAELYELGGALQYQTVAAGPGTRVVFPGDIEPGLFAILVNYVRYPENLEPGERRIESIGLTTLTPAFALPAPNLAGKRALIYVPVDDEECDRVFVNVGGYTYENSFAANHWRAVEGACMSAEAAAAAIQWAKRISTRSVYAQ